jgi:hypothetical protein
MPGTPAARTYQKKSFFTFFVRDQNAAAENERVKSVPDRGSTVPLFGVMTAGIRLSRRKLAS